MSLAEKILAVSEQPGSVKARVALASELSRMKLPESRSVWEAALQLAIFRGEFFTALALCRLRYQGAALQEKLTLLAQYFSKEAQRNASTVGSVEPEPWSVELPKELDYQVVLALKIGTILTGLQLPGEIEPPKIPIFSQLSVPDFVLLAQKVEALPLKEGDVLIEQGNTEQAAFLASHGCFRVMQQRGEEDEVELATVEAPALIGEMYLLSRVPRRASVIAQKTSMVWKISAELLKMLSRKHASLHQHIQQLFKQRLLENLVLSSALLGELAPERRERFLKTFQVRSIQPGEEVFAQGTTAQGLFLILHGEASVMTNRESGRRIHVADLFEGDTFGEISTLTGEATTASVWMPQGGLLLHLPLEAYQSIRSLVPKLDQKLRELMETRKSELADFVEPLDSGFEELGEAWLLDEAEFLL